MKIDREELALCPDIMSKEQMYKLCHIGKRTATYLLVSGLIPCERTGKQTRCYKVKKSDIIAFLNDREEHPGKYIVPEGWYQSSGKRVRSYMIRVLPINEETQQDCRSYYTNALTAYPDIMETADICAFTGYNKRTVAQWVRMGHLKPLMKTNKLLVPKCYLIDHLCSEWYNDIIRKSPKHLSDIWNIHHHCKEAAFYGRHD